MKEISFRMKKEIPQMLQNKQHVSKCITCPLPGRSTNKVWCPGMESNSQSELLFQSAPGSLDSERL